MLFSNDVARVSVANERSIVIWTHHDLTSTPEMTSKAVPLVHYTRSSRHGVVYLLQKNKEWNLIISKLQARKPMMQCDKLS